MDDHIVLFGWSLDDKKNEAVVLDIARDKYRPRIELQGGCFVLQFLHLFFLHHGVRIVVFIW